MKKIKKFIILAMATTMLFGATLTVNAAETTPCKYCNLSGPVKHIKCFEHECEWLCQKCNMYFRK